MLTRGASLLFTITLLGLILATPMAAQTPSQAQLKQDIQYARQYMQSWEEYLVSLKKAGWDNWGFSFSSSWVHNLQQILNDAYRALLKDNPTHALELLELWEDTIDALDKTAELSLRQAQQRYLQEEWQTKVISSVEEWLQQAQQQEYDLNDFIPQWQNLREKLSILMNAFTAHPQETTWKELEEWETQYTMFEAEVEYALNVQSQEQQQIYKQILKTWLSQTRPSLEAEYQSLHKAQQEIQKWKLKSVSEEINRDVDMLKTALLLLKQAEEAFNQNIFSHTEALISTLSSEIIEPRRDLAKQRQEVLKELEQGARNSLQEIDGYIQYLIPFADEASSAALRQSSQVLHEILSQAQEQSRAYCSIYNENCSELDEQWWYIALVSYQELYDLSEELSKKMQEVYAVYLGFPTLDELPQVVEKELDTLTNKEIEELAKKENIPNIDTEITADQVLAQEERRSLPEDIEHFFQQFDLDQDQQLSLAEAAGFFYWVEEHIQYRWDDEATTQEEARSITLIGDGRPGPDYRQRPEETLYEQAGDCEDLATLATSFYRFWGIAAFMAGINAEDPRSPDHAVAIVYIGEDGETYREFLGDLVSWEFTPEEQILAYDIESFPAGSYMLVDNSYSDDFGYVTNGIEDTKFNIYCLAPDDAPYDEAWNQFVQDCSYAWTD